MDSNAPRPTNSPIWAASGRQSLSRRRWVVSLALLVLLLLLFGGTSTLALVDPPSTIVCVVYDRDIAAIISQVTTQTLEYELNGLTGERPVVVSGSSVTIVSRKTYIDKEMRLATQYAYEQFTSFGLDTAFHNYVWTADWASGQRFLPRSRPTCASRNVVAEKPGLVDPARIYLLTAHIDDMPAGPRAPGADDNASGSITILTAARLLAPHDFAYTIRFVLFTGEEQGLHGSAAYAGDCAAQGQDIRGVVNLDMIAYNSDPEPIIDLYTSRDVPGSVELVRDFSSVITIYGLNLIPHRFDDPISGFTYRSDQGSFLARSYPAMLVIEDWDDHTPHYHKVSDRVSTLDLDYYADVVRAAIAIIVYLAVPLQ